MITVPDTADGMTEPKLRSSILVRVSGISSKARPGGGAGEDTGAAAALVAPRAMPASARISLDRIVTLQYPSKIVCQSNWLTTFWQRRVTDD